MLGIQRFVFPYLHKLPEGLLLAIYLSSDQNPGWLGYIGDYTAQLYGDYFINLYKDAY